MLHSLVTGASRGIGRAIAVALSQRGDRVAVHYGSDQDAAAHTLSLLHGEGHVLVGGDLSDRRSRSASSATCSRSSGGSTFS